jgi:hypothetical protein
VARVLATAAVELAISKQTDIRGDLGAVEFELDSAVENEPQRQLFGFTHHLPHERAPCSAATS